MKKIFTLLSLFIAGNALAQNQYLVTFKDKGPEAAYLRQHPAQILSEKALARRAKSQVKLTAEDLPVSHQYLSQLKQNGIKIQQKSKWLNMALIETDWSETALQRKFPAIRSVKKVAAPVKGEKNKFPEVKPANNQNSRLSYGAAADQIDQLNLDCLHDKGCQGKGVLVAIFDSGFPGVNTGTVYDSLRLQNRILATRNFVNRANTVYGTHDHGTAVFSIIAANSPGDYVGGAAQATFALALTENTASETHQEELNWAAAAEWADSLGVDIIQTSLGYKNFDPGQGDYTNAMIDGDTPIITKAADKAAQKGMLVIIAAGNDGNNPVTGTITSRVNPPCDGDSVLCVGSVTNQNQYSSFSSVGPTAKNRIKPDVVARGSATAFVNPADMVSYTNGTSLAAPLITALAACVMQANPNASNMQVYQAIIQSADKYVNPDNFYGYGLPDACKADSLLRTIAGFSENVARTPFKVYPTVFQDQITIEAPVTMEVLEISLYSVTGQKVQIRQTQHAGKQVLRVESSLPAGLYLLQLNQKNSHRFQYKVVKQ
ncbi:S8 family peptidase [Adhaeribacter sp. BT258]|uniref:S8 family peptidase n=1 Tax=Adhaeribacter terrigena TaxID=2793070 RepID=A0ABS1C1B7_9BACT|nr:S8 family peptidase [Adhaeribacter terrigena]MBK0403196.1 S8 family peptidase [Adhaeribacter terrigena]